VGDKRDKRPLDVHLVYLVHLGFELRMVGLSG
jgi:hypothetical protein